MGTYNNYDSNNRTELHNAAKEGDCDKVSKILMYGQHTGGLVTDSDGIITNAFNTVFYLIGCITYPLSIGYYSFTDFVYVDGKDKLGNTPLHYAAQHGNKDLVELFAIYRANLKATNKEGYTPLENAIKTGNYENAIMLLKSGAILNQNHIKLKEDMVFQHLCEHSEEYKNDQLTLQDLFRAIGNQLTKKQKVENHNHTEHSHTEHDYDHIKHSETPLDIIAEHDPNEDWL